ncbi:cytochrome P450 [Amycolatopsis sp. QT-25]|uniref:cytochrome P450 n=1 Tax=Amycolatopsis sp. QT-25 TaxID=3034022 RepID=UPI0023EC3BC6|nr:cytochrome P450 [Amycolatopsis sp. QT-25]WET80798.1 cytochrome P450 [Amycolatopsis sp. QT-25]
MTAATTAKIPQLAPGAVPVLGHLPLILRSRFDFIDAAGSVKPVSRVKFGPKNAYFVNDHELLQQILVSDADKFIRGIHFKKMRNMVGNGVVTTSGDMHRRQRRTMLPSFTQRRLALSLPIIRKIISQFVDQIPPDTAYDLMPPLLGVGCDITATTLFGEGCSRNVLDLVREAIPVFVSNAAIHAVDVTGVYKHLPTRSNRNFRRLLDEFNGYLYSIIDERMAKGGDEQDLLGMLIRATDPETGEKFSRTEVRDQSATVMFASTETTANTVSWAAYELARHPRVFSQCRAEVDALVNGGAVGEIEVGRDDLPTVKRAVMEALRLYPSSYLLSRQTAKDVTLGGYAIPEGATILYSHYGQQRDEVNFSHADEFDPDRWLDKNGSEITPAAYMPFGYGAYRCMGESVATLEAIYYIAMMVHQWDFRVSETAAPRMNATITLSPHDLKLVFSKRVYGSEQRG